MGGGGGRDERGGDSRDGLTGREKPLPSPDRYAFLRAQTHWKSIARNRIGKKDQGRTGKGGKTGRPEWGSERGGGKRELAEGGVEFMGRP